MSHCEVIVRGGLGNQLFCLLHAYRLLLSNNQVSLNLASYSINRREDRRFILEKLSPLLSEEFRLNRAKSAYFLFIYAYLTEKYLIKLNTDRLPGDKSFSLNYLPNRFLHSGYFQKIDKSNLDIKALKLMFKKISPYLRGIKSENLAIHLRRGDYLHKKHIIHGIVSEKDIFEESKKQIKNDHYSGITIFSDSPNLINLDIYKSLHHNVVFDQGGDSFEVFKRMMNHKGLIASNSSFSLWAGILGKIKNFSIPFFWMKNTESSLIGLKHIPRYDCDL